jgi:tellurite resistance protein TerC
LQLPAASTAQHANGETTTKEFVVFVWVAFVAFILALLALDLGVFHRKAHAVSPREGLAWSAVWLTLALTFSLFVYGAYEYRWFGLGLTPDAVDRSADMPDGIVNDGASAVLKYLTGYVVEQSLSIDNMFVIAVLFRSFAVPVAYQPRVLFWGIIGALAMRGLMIGVGAVLVTKFAWVFYIFGAFLIATAVKMLFLDSNEQPDPGNNVVVRVTRRFVPVTKRFYGQRFIIRRAGTVLLTPLALALIMIETTDLLFAVDSIPAIFAITADPFLVFASNAFAILGLRSLYFVLAGALTKFRYLQISLALVLALIGVKMMLHTWLKDMLGEYFSLYVLAAVLVILAAGVIASLAVRGNEADEGHGLTRGAAK